MQKVLTETPQHFCTQETETKIKTAVNEELQAVEQELKSLLVKAS